MYRLRKYWWHPLPYLVATALTIFYLKLPAIAQQVVANPNYRNYAHGDADMIVSFIQKTLVYPFGNMLDYGPRSFLVFPYWVLLIIILRGIYIHSRKFWKGVGALAVMVFFILWFAPNLLLKFENGKGSLSSGSVANGRIANSKRMHFQGSNFTTYSFICYLAGRTFVHDKVRQVVLDAYTECEKTCPDKKFVIGEIGLRKGGRFLPHRTHRNGMSVDFMTPLLKKGKAYHRHHPFNLWGYAMEFDNTGKNGSIAIDYETLAKHLLALKKAAAKNNMAITKIIFDPILQPFLFQTSVGNSIQDLPFTKKRVVIRHDDHYHVDFGMK